MGIFSTIKKGNLMLLSTISSPPDIFKTYVRLRLTTCKARVECELSLIKLTIEDDLKKHKKEKYFHNIYMEFHHKLAITVFNFFGEQNDQGR